MTWHLLLVLTTIVWTEGSPVPIKVCVYATHETQPPDEWRRVHIPLSSVCQGWFREFEV